MIGIIMAATSKSYINSPPSVPFGNNHCRTSSKTKPYTAPVKVPRVLCPAADKSHSKAKHPDWISEFVYQSAVFYAYFFFWLLSFAPYASTLPICLFRYFSILVYTISDCRLLDVACRAFATKKALLRDCPFVITLLP